MIPLYKLSVRDDPSRDPTRKVKPGIGMTRLKSPKRAVILIHGFANSQDAAESSYKRLLVELRESFWPHDPTGETDFFGFHWPGDHPGLVRNFISFSTRVGPASASGDALGEALSELPPTKQVVLVGHSLGCRVLLRALHYLEREATPRPGPSISAAVLLAAAVPVEDCRPAGLFSARHARRYSVLHSWRDWVLLVCFPSGQWLYDTGDTAVGRSGNPEGERWDDRMSTDLGHSSYWVSPMVAREVGRAVAPARIHLLPERLTPLESDAFGSEWTLPVWHLAARALSVW